MRLHIKKKITSSSDKSIGFFRKNLAEIIFLVFSFEILLAAKSLPYINLIKNYEFYVTALFLFLAMVIFRIIIPYRKVVQIILSLSVIAAILSILGNDSSANVMGFVIFILILLIVVKQIFEERKDLQKLE
jgi:hypothetical protein